MAINSLSALNMMSMNRITGLTSGIDTDSIVKNLMKVQQVKYDKMMQAKTLAEWKKSAYTDINKALSDFKDAYASFIDSSSKTNMMSANTYKNYAVDMPSNGSLSATASSTAREGSYTVTVEQLARGAALTGTATTTNSNGLSSSIVSGARIEDIASFAGGQVSGEINFTVNGKEFTFQSTDTLKKIMDTVNQSDAGVTMSYSQITNAFVIESKQGGIYVEGMTQPTAPPAFDFDYETAGGTLTMPDFMEEPAEGASEAELEAYAAYSQQVTDYQDDYNEKYNAAVQAYRDETGDDWTQYNKDLAAYNQNEARLLNVTDDSGFLNVIGLGASATKTESQLAKVTVNGTQITRDSNGFELDGVTFKLTKESADPVTFTVKQDVQASTDAIKNLVDAYNTLLTKLYGQLNEKKNYGYAPLTDEQRSALSEKDAALWDDKAKSGILRGDSTLQSLTDSLQRAFTSTIGDMGTLSSVGISGVGYRVGMPNLMQVDPDKLRAALQDDPDKVYRMFASAVNGADGKLDVSKSGLMQKLTSAMDAFVTSTKNNGLKALDDSINDWSKKMQAEITRLYNVQEGYYKKFTAMETAMAKMQSQTSALSAMGYQQG